MTAKNIRVQHQKTSEKREDSPWKTFILFNKRNSRQEYRINSDLPVNLFSSSTENIKPQTHRAILHKEKHWEKEANLTASNGFTVKS